MVARVKVRKRPRPVLGHATKSRKEARSKANGAHSKVRDKSERTRVVHDADTFGPLPKGVTHFCLTRHSANGQAERCYLPQNGVAVERFPLSMLHVAKIRATWGPGHYKGQWLRIDEFGKWQPAGKTREVRLLSDLSGEPPRAASRHMGSAEPSYHSEVEPAPVAVVDVLPPEVIDARIRAEQEISRIRLAAEREVGAERLALQTERLRFETERQIAALRQELSTSMVVRRRRDEDDDDDEPGPWDWLGPLLENLKPTLQEVLPPLLTKLAKLASS